MRLLCIDAEIRLANREIDYIIVPDGKITVKQKLQRVSSERRNGYGDIKSGYQVGKFQAFLSAVRRGRISEAKLKKESQPGCGRKRYHELQLFRRERAGRERADQPG